MKATWPDKIAMPGRILPMSMLATRLHSSLNVSKHSTVWTLQIMNSKSQEVRSYFQWDPLTPTLIVFSSKFYDWFSKRFLLVQHGTFLHFESKILKNSITILKTNWPLLKLHKRNKKRDFQSKLKLQRVKGPCTKIIDAKIKLKFENDKSKQQKLSLVHFWTLLNYKEMPIIGQGTENHVCWAFGFRKRAYPRVRPRPRVLLDETYLIQ